MTQQLASITIKSEPVARLAKKLDGQKVAASWQVVERKQQKSACLSAKRMKLFETKLNKIEEKGKERNRRERSGFGWTTS